MGNLNLYSTYAFKTNKSNNSKNNNLSNYPLNSIQNEFLEDIYFVAFDKYVSNKILSKKDEVYINGILDKRILKANFEDFDQGLISEICLELMHKNIIKKLKAPKTLEQLTLLFTSKYNKKFDFEGQNLNDFLVEKVLPVVKRRITRYDKSLIDEMKTLVELSLHNIHDGKIIIDGEEVYDFEKFFEQYNNYANFSERIIQLEIEKAILDNGESVDNIKHTLKYYTPQIIRMDKCFISERSNTNEEQENLNLGYVNKILASINYYLPKVTQLTLTNNNLDKIFNSSFLPCIKLLKNLNMLNLSSNKLNEDNIKELFGYLKQNETIKILFLDNNNISSECGYYMADSFKKNKTIEKLYLANNQLNGDGFDAFLNILQNDNITLKELNISYNELVSQNFKSLSKYFNSNPALKTLDISGNKLAPQDANVIGVTFKKLTNLIEIKLNNCGISDDSVAQLFNFLNESSIQFLEIDSNNFGMTGPMVVMKKIQVSTKLKYFSYKNMEIQPYFFGMIAKTLTDNPGLEKINLKENKIKDDEIKTLVNAIANLKNKKIILSKDKLSTNAINIINGNKSIILE